VCARRPVLQSVGPVDETSPAGRVEMAGGAATTPRTLREGLDPEGRRIRLSFECGTYQGARPYFVASRVDKRGACREPARYTPFRDLAELYFDAFVAGITSPRDVKCFLESRRLGLPFTPPSDPEEPERRPMSPAQRAALANARAARARRARADVGGQVVTTGAR
jgi:hypothetical protein